jgi:HK97 family phage prohead protease
MSLKTKAKTKKPLEQRSYSFEVRAEDTEHGHIITGRPIVYDSKTDLGLFDEIIERGALKNTDLTDVRFLVNHDLTKIPLARSRRNNVNSTMHLTVDDDGLGIRVTLDTENNSEARALYSAVQRGDISGMSFMFGVDGEQWEDLDTEHPTRHIQNISTVVEVSAVTFPAYSDTTINARSKEALESARLALDNAKQQRAATVDTDDTNEVELLKLKIQIIGGL